MTGWNVVFLGEAENDLSRFEGTNRGLGSSLREQLHHEFKDEFKGRRFLDLIQGQVRSAHLDRLDGSAFPKSYRVQLVHDHRATLCCLVELRLIIVVHVFSKATDPTYRRALVEHNRRLQSYFLNFKEFVDRAELLARRGPS